MGCVLAELMLRTPYLPGTSDLNQLETIFRALGTPSELDWPDMAKLPNFVRFQPMERPPIKATFTGASDDVLDLLQRLLAFDPLRRLTAEQALRHPYFQNDPRPTPPEKLPRVAPGTAKAAAPAPRYGGTAGAALPDAKRSRDAVEDGGADSPAPDLGATRRRLVFD